MIYIFCSVLFLFFVLYHLPPHFFFFFLNNPPPPKFSPLPLPAPLPICLRPPTAPATALGDTIHYAATVTDKNGSILVGARPTWTTGDSSIAVVAQDGSVIARGPEIGRAHV